MFQHSKIHVHVLQIIYLKQVDYQDWVPVFVGCLLSPHTLALYINFLAVNVWVYEVVVCTAWVHSTWNGNCKPGDHTVPLATQGLQVGSQIRWIAQQVLGALACAFYSRSFYSFLVNNPPQMFSYSLSEVGDLCFRFNLFLSLWDHFTF